MNQKEYASRNLHMANMNRKSFWSNYRYSLPTVGLNNVKDPGVILLYSHINHTKSMSPTLTTSSGVYVFLIGN